MKNYLDANKIKLLVLTLFIVFLAGSIEMPVSGISECSAKSLYSVDITDIFKITIDVTNKSNQEAETEIRNKLREAGIINPSIQFEKNSKGGRLIKVTVPPEAIQNGSGIDLTIKDGQTVSRTKEVKNTGHDDGKSYKDMTDAEIRNKVREDIGDPGLSDSMIQIDRSGRSIKVKVTREDGSEKGKLEIEEEVR
jgi:hypothetical protein